MTSTTTQTKAPQYVLGHSPEELERLIRQSSFYNRSTEETLQRAGISAGMTVLDVGCGAGDVALCAAQLVGPEGNVVAIDQSPDALALASYRAGEQGLRNITFLQADLNTYLPDTPVDAVVGRLVLLYQRNPVASLQHLLDCVKPGGIFAFQEFNLLAAKSWPATDFFDDHINFLNTIFEKAGMDPMIGARLFYHMEAAGLQDLDLSGFTHIIAGENAKDGIAYLINTLRSLMPAAQKLGVAPPTDLGLDTVEQSLFDLCRRDQILINTPMMIGVWGKS